MYFGSVRFFKHLIVLVVIVGIILPYVIAINIAIKQSEISKQLKETEAVVTSFNEKFPAEMTQKMHQQIDESFIAHKAVIKNEIDAYVTEKINGINRNIDDSMADKMDALEISTNKMLDKLNRDLSDSVSSQVSSLRDQLNEYSSLHKVSP